MLFFLAHAGTDAMNTDTLANALLALVTLTAMEIVLGIDNIVFISLVVEKVEAGKQALARRTGLLLAMGLRIGLLVSISWIIKLTGELFTLWGHAFSGRDLILLAGGLFLVGKSTFEIHERVEGPPEEEALRRRAGSTLMQAIVQILILDLVFSLDSVITAVGMARDLWVMITAVVAAVGVMLIFAGYIAEFIHKHPTLKMLALSFLILIGVMLLVEGLGNEVNKGYIYFAMAFALGVELLNIRAGNRRKAAAASGA